MADSPRRRPSLEWLADLGTWARLSFPGIALAAALAIALAWFIPRQMERQFLAAQMEADQALLSYLTSSRAIDMAGRPNPEVLEQFVRDALDSGQFVRVKLWSPDATVLYSDEASLIGRQFDLDEDFPTMFAPTSHVSDLEADENVIEREQFDVDLLETYVPLVEDGDVVAVWEIYRPHIELSPREQQVIALIADGLSTKQVATELDLSESTVKTYMRTLFEKLGATHRAHAVALAIRHRIID